MVQDGSGFLKITVPYDKFNRLKPILLYAITKELPNKIRDCGQ